MVPYGDGMQERVLVGAKAKDVNAVSDDVRKKTMDSQQAKGEPGTLKEPSRQYFHTLLWNSFHSK